MSLLLLIKSVLAVSVLCVIRCVSIHLFLCTISVCEWERQKCFNISKYPKNVLMPGGGGNVGVWIKDKCE